MDMDVQEIDAASYNGVDEVRRLQEGLAFRPARDRFKIYIVDEVHMLSNAAWNAFLKTLEEPPPHVKFIFATTEVHKVPVTILSRCQRYDFKLVSAKQIGARLKDVLGRESLQADDGAVSVLAREAAGSMRDAMSLLDQVIAYGSEKISAEDVARVLGVADREVLTKLTGAVLGGDAQVTLEVLDAVSRQGFDLVHLCRDLLHHVRNVVVAKVCPPEKARELLDLADEEVADVVALAQKSDADDLTRLFTGLSKGYDEIVKSGHVRAALEMTLVRLARRPQLLPLDELLARLGELEKRLATGAPPPARGGGSATGSGSGGRSREPAAQASSASPLGSASPASLTPSGSVANESQPRAATPIVPTPPASASRLVVTQTSGSLALAAPEFEPEPDLATEIDPEAYFKADRSGTAPPEPTPVPLSAVTAVVAVVAESSAIELWRSILARIRNVRPAVAATLELAAPKVVTPEKIVLGFEPGSFEDGRAEESDARTVLAEEAKAIFGVAPAVTFDVAAHGARGSSVASLDAAKRKAALAEARALVERHPLVQKAIAIFDAELRDIRIPGGQGED